MFLLFIFAILNTMYKLTQHKVNYAAWDTLFCFCSAIKKTILIPCYYCTKTLLENTVFYLNGSELLLYKNIN